MATKNQQILDAVNLLANELLGEMWVSDRIPANLQANFQGGGGTDGATYTSWYSEVQATLPGSITNPPTVSVDPATSNVTIVMRWLQPSEPAGTAPHSYTVVAQIQ